MALRSWNRFVARHRRVSFAVAAALVVVTGVLAAGQLLLPGLAASRLRTALRADGTVQSVSVSATPALKLLWGQADSVRVRFATLHADVARTGTLLGRAHAAGDIDVRIARLIEGPLTLTDASFRKRGDRIVASAVLSQAALRRALPAGLSVRPHTDGQGRLVFHAVASIFGFALGGDVLLDAREGRVVLTPAGLPALAGFAQLTVFGDPHVHIDRVSATGGQGGEFVVTATGRLLR
jgi:hypothetical protein